jgi:hypothetical protein
VSGSLRTTPRSLGFSGRVVSPEVRTSTQGQEDNVYKELRNPPPQAGASD